MQQLWRMNKMNLMLTLREFIEGETATLWFLRSADETVTPSQISDSLRISRARTANILRSLRNKGLIAMEIDDDDRRKMHVDLTEAGRDFFRRKYAFIVRYFDMYVDVIGEKDISELNRLLHKTVESEKLLKSRQMLQEDKDDR